MKKKLMDLFRYEGYTDGQARERAKKLLAAIKRPLLRKIRELKKNWVECHRQCGVEFHKAYCPFPKCRCSHLAGDTKNCPIHPLKQKEELCKKCGLPAHAHRLTDGCPIA